VLLRLSYLGVTNALAMLRLLPMSDQAKDAEILALSRHQITVLERQLQGAKLRFAPADRAPGDHRPSGPSARWRYAWPARTARGDTGASMVSSWSWA
jgi:hypothetical protein